jgi:hypothetical protein
MELVPPFMSIYEEEHITGNGVIIQQGLSSAEEFIKVFYIYELEIPSYAFQLER